MNFVLLYLIFGCLYGILIDWVMRQYSDEKMNLVDEFVYLMVILWNIIVWPMGVYAIIKEIVSIKNLKNDDK